MASSDELVGGGERAEGEGGVLRGMGGGGVAGKEELEL